MPYKVKVPENEYFEEGDLYYIDLALEKILIPILQKNNFNIDAPYIHSIGDSSTPEDESDGDFIIKRNINSKIPVHYRRVIEYFDIEKNAPTWINRPPENKKCDLKSLSKTINNINHVFECFTIKVDECAYDFWLKHDNGKFELSSIFGGALKGLYKIIENTNSGICHAFKYYTKETDDHIANPIDWFESGLYIDSSDVLVKAFRENDIDFTIERLLEMIINYIK